MQTSFLTASSLTVLFILLIGIFFRKRIYLQYLAIRYGKFSFAYVKQFKKYTNKSPFIYCFKDEILPYLRLSFKEAVSNNIFHTSSMIYFENIQEGYSQKWLLKDWGRPDCFNVFTIDGIELKAFGYEVVKFDRDAIAVFFLLNDSFVFGEYIYKEFKESDLEDIHATLCHDYNIKERINTSLFKIINEDQQTVLFYENGFTITIRYFNSENIALLDLIKQKNLS